MEKVAFMQSGAKCKIKGNKKRKEKERSLSQILVSGNVFSSAFNSLPDVLLTPVVSSGCGCGLNLCIIETFRHLTFRPTDQPLCGCCTSGVS
jgi:hypothetical protein